MNQPIHILNQLGVITSFQVAKKVTEEYINKYFAKQKKSGKSEEEINNLLRDQILKEIQGAVENNKIPGLISAQELAKQLNIHPKIANNLPELNRLIMVIAHKISERKYDKMSLCYFINSLVNLLGLSEEDFEKFHREGEDGDDDDKFGTKDA
jgi:predicted transcriptional regulator